MDGYRRFMADPKAHWEERMRPRRESGFGTSITEAKPNPGHLALAEMEAMGLLKALITQNIDNLHTLASSRKVLEIHGNAHKLRCVSCSARFPRRASTYRSSPQGVPSAAGS